MNKAHRLSGALAIAVSVAGSSAPARAQALGDAKVLAESLFREGRKLMDAGNVAEGCRRLAESQRIDPAPGTLLALAACHEREGRVATAWSEFTQSLSTARREQRADREAFAQEHLTALEPLVPRVAIEVPHASRIEGLTLARNGTELTETAWGLPLPSDPGEIVVTAKAPGRKAWTKSITVAKGEAARIIVPVLEVMPVVAAPAPTSPDAAIASGEATRSGSGARTAGIVVGSVGIVALGVGSYFGVRALDKRADSDAGCPSVNGALRCTQAGVDANDQARTSATLANVGIGVGVAGVLVGAYLYFVASPRSIEPPAPGARLRVVPRIATDGTGATLLGVW